MSVGVRSRVAVCVGINQYPNPANNLQGCVNDAVDWANVLKTIYGFDIISLHDRNATRANVLNALRSAVAMLDDDSDSFVFTNSSHGTTTADRNGDESDGRDEAICCYDGLIIDDELFQIMQSRRKGKLTVISDSCHSGTVTRAQLASTNPNEDTSLKNYLKPRYIPPEDDSIARAVGSRGFSLRNLFSIMRKQDIDSSKMCDVLISGCKNTEYSYDAYFNGRYNGAMTYHAVNIIRANPELTYNAFYSELRKRLPSTQHPQTPQCEGKDVNRNQKLFI